MQWKGEESNCFHHDKTKLQQLYDNVCTVLSKFGTVEMLQQLYHPYSSQKSELLNQQVSRVAPKDKHFSSTMSLHDRINLVIITDSVGYHEGLSQICKGLSMQLFMPSLVFLQKKDRHRVYMQAYHKRKPVKAKQMIFS